MSIITVIIPHYNIPNLLVRCLNSIPDEERIQVIVVDNNSSPSKVNFENFPGIDRKHTEVVFDKEGNGAGHARNVALEKIASKWIVFADADDFFNPGAFDELLKYSDNDNDLIMFKVGCVNSDTLIPANRDGILINKAIDKYLQHEVVLDKVLFNNQAPWGKMIKSELIRKHNITFDEVKYANDIMFSTKVACNVSRVAVSAFELYTLTVRSGSLTSSNKSSEENFLCRMEVKIRMNKYLQQYKKPMLFLPSFLVSARNIGWHAVWSAFKLIMKNGMLFAGASTFIRYQIDTKLKHKDVI